MMCLDVLHLDIQYYSAVYFLVLYSGYSLYKGIVFFLTSHNEYFFILVEMKCASAFTLLSWEQ